MTLLIENNEKYIIDVLMLWIKYDNDYYIKEVIKGTLKGMDLYFYIFLIISESHLYWIYKVGW